MIQERREHFPCPVQREGAGEGGQLQVSVASVGTRPQDPLHTKVKQVKTPPSKCHGSISFASVQNLECTFTVMYGLMFQFCLLWVLCIAVVGLLSGVCVISVDLQLDPHHEYGLKKCLFARALCLVNALFKC